MEIPDELTKPDDLSQTGSLHLTLIRETTG